MSKLSKKRRDAKRKTKIAASNKKKTPLINNHKRSLIVNKSSTSRVMVQCATNVNRDAIRRESIEGIEHIIITSMTLPDDIVMNGGLYPAEEIKNSYHTLERTLAPVEHPQDSQGNYISANDPEAIHKYHAGAFNANVEHIKNRVKIDKFINVQEALKSDRGRRLLDRITELEESKDPRPIHTSVGVWLTPEELTKPATNSKGQEYTWIARDMLFDHDAILLDSVGAAQPDQGVGMAVNRQGEKVTVHKYEINAIRAARNLPLADTGTRWDKGAADKRVRAKIGAEDAPNATYATYHLWYDAENSENFGAYKLGFVDIIDGEARAVPNALRNAAARLSQTQGPSDAEKTRIQGIIDSYLEKLRGNAEGLSMSERTEAIEKALQDKAIGVTWIAEIFEDEVIFYAGETLFSVPYRIDDNGIATIVGIPLTVERIVTYSPKTNSDKGDVMKDIIVNALKTAKIQIDGLTDEQLMAEYNKLLSANQSGDDGGAGNEGSELATVVANALKPITEKLEGVVAKLNEKDTAEVDNLAEIVANSGKYPGLDAESAKLLPLDKLKALAANCQPAYGISPVMHANSGKDDAFSAPVDMPE